MCASFGKLVLYFNLTDMVKKWISLSIDKKNQAYGRQNISRLMQIVERIQKKLLVRQNSPGKKNFFLCGDFTPFISKSCLERLYNCFGKHNLLPHPCRITS